jgi:hypothetical protein
MYNNSGSLGRSSGGTTGAQSGDEDGDDDLEKSAIMPLSSEAVEPTPRHEQLDHGDYLPQLMQGVKRVGMPPLHKAATKLAPINTDDANNGSFPPPLASVDSSSYLDDRHRELVGLQRQKVKCILRVYVRLLCCLCYLHDVVLRMLLALPL